MGQPPAKPRRSRSVLWFSLFAIVAIGVGVLVTRVWFPSQEPFHELVAELRARGEPVDPSGFIPAPVPPDENGAALLMEALAWVEAVHGEDWKQTVTGPWDPFAEYPWEQSASPERMAELTAFVESLGPFMERVNAAVARPALRFRGAGIHDDGYVNIDEIPDLQTLANLLWSIGVVTRDRERHMDAIDAQLHVPLQWRRGSMVAELVAVALFSYGCKMLRDGVATGRIDPAEARERFGGALRTPWCPRLPLVVRRERGWCMHLWAEGLEGRGPLATGEWSVSLRKPFSQGALPEYRFADATELSRVIDAIAELEVHVDRDDSPTVQRIVDSVDGQAFPVTKAVLLGVPITLERMQRLDAACALARIGLALAEHEQRTGAFPASLDDLSDSFPDGIPIDPFSGKPFVYQHSDEGVRVSSIGSEKMRAEFVAEDAAGLAEELRDTGLSWELPGEGGPLR